jgi:CRISPR-associated protein Cmr3
MPEKQVWLIDPHDPLIFREGKPFGPTPGAQARSLPFPFPSTTTGGVRTQVGSENGLFTMTSDEQLARL